MADQPTIDRLLREAVCSGAEFGARYDLRLEMRDQGPTLVVSGSLLQDIPEDFSDRLKAALDALKAPAVFIDLAKCEAVASTALAFLVHVQRMATAAGAESVSIQQPQPRVLALLRLLGLSEIFHLASTARFAYRTPRPPAR
jgi:ABC-type transporter Mla MlaB component